MWHPDRSSQANRRNGPSRCEFVRLCTPAMQRDGSFGQSQQQRRWRGIHGRFLGGSVGSSMAFGDPPHQHLAECLTHPARSGAAPHPGSNRLARAYLVSVPFPFWRSARSTNDANRSKVKNSLVELTAVP